MPEQGRKRYIIKQRMLKVFALMPLVRLVPTPVYLRQRSYRDGDVIETRRFNEEMLAVVQWDHSFPKDIWIWDRESKRSVSLEDPKVEPILECWEVLMYAAK